jgi:DNA-binding response OmpR family regulator
MEMSPPKILLLEGERANGSSFAPPLRKRYEVLLAYTGKQATAALQSHQPQVVVVDSLSMRTSGVRLCQNLRQEAPKLPIIYLKHPDDDEAEASPANVCLVAPFTYRKVLNRIKRYISPNPEPLLHGPEWQLNLSQGLLQGREGETKLNPKLAALLATLMQHQGEVVSRACLLAAAWGQANLKDSSTLDVHMRWLRQALQEVTQQSGWIKTQRGKGYILLGAGGPAQGR